MAIHLSLPKDDHVDNSRLFDVWDMKHNCWCDRSHLQAIVLQEEEFQYLLSYNIDGFYVDKDGGLFICVIYPPYHVIQTLDAERFKICWNK